MLGIDLDRPGSLEAVAADSVDSAESAVAGFAAGSVAAGLVAELAAGPAAGPPVAGIVRSAR